MLEVMGYFGLNHRPSSGVKCKLNELRVTFFTLESQINTECEWIDVTWWIKWTTENIVDKLAIKVHLENTTIAEILLSEKNLLLTY